MAKVNKYSLKARLNLDEIYNIFLGFDSRERLFAISGVLLVLLIVVFVPLSCASSKISEKQSNILSHEKNMDELVAKLKDYQSSQARLKAVQSKWAGRSKISLSATLEDLSRQSGLDKNIDSIKESPPSGGDKEALEENLASVRVTRAPLSQVLDFFYKIESFGQGGIKIKKLLIKPRYESRQLFDVTFDVSTYSLKEGGGK